MSISEIVEGLDCSVDEKDVLEVVFVLSEKNIFDFKVVSGVFVCWADIEYRVFSCILGLESVDYNSIAKELRDQ